MLKQNMEFICFFFLTLLDNEGNSGLVACTFFPYHFLYDLPSAALVSSTICAIVNSIWMVWLHMEIKSFSSDDVYITLCTYVLSFTGWHSYGVFWPCQEVPFYTFPVSASTLTLSQCFWSDAEHHIFAKKGRWGRKGGVAVEVWSWGDWFGLLRFEFWTFCLDLNFA